MSGENWIVLGTMIIYLLFMLWIGRRTSHSISDLDSYILAGRNLSWPILALTYLATVASTVQLLGQPGLAYENGFSLYFWEKIMVVTIIIIFVIPLARRLRGLEVSTIPDIALTKFPNSKRIHYILTITQIFWGIFVAALSVFGGSLLVTAVTGIPLSISLLVIVGITLGYTILGGLSAVVVTDAAQWSIIIIGSAIFIPLLYLAVDPFTAFFSQYVGPDGFSLTQAASNTNIEPGFTDIYTLPVAPLTALAFLITSGGLPAVDPSYAQRLLAAKNEREGRKGLYVFAAIYLLIMTLILSVGMYGAGLRPSLENPDQILLVMAQDYLPLFGKALFLTAVAAAAMSTVSSYFNVTAGMIVKNLILEFKPNLSKERQIFWARISTVLAALATLSFAPIASSGLAVAAVAAQIILISAVGPLIYLILFWRRFTEKAAFWGTLITSIATFGLVIVVGGPNAAVLGPGFLGVPVQFWGFLIAAVSFGGLSLLEPYSPQKLSPKFRLLFEDRSQKVGPSKKGLAGVCIMWVLLFVPWGYMKITGEKFVFPFLGGPFAWMTDALLLVVALLVFAVSVYLLSRLVKLLRSNLNHRNIEETDQKQTIGK